MKVQSFVVVFPLAVVMIAGVAGAAELSASGVIQNPVTVEPDRAPGDPVNLVLDDGSVDNNIGIGGTSEFIFVNRFTPTEFPIQLDHVQVWFSAGTGMAVGQTFDVYLFANTSGNTDPAVGAVYVGGQTGNTIATLDSWTDVALTTPLDFAGPGDVVVVVVHRLIPGSTIYPAALDQTATQQRSWAGWYTTPNVPDPPTLPPDNTWTLIDAYFPGNWLVRATGSVVPVELMTLTVD
jgi:hypothetical protein